MAKQGASIKKADTAEGKDRTKESQRSVWLAKGRRDDAGKLP